MSEQWWKPADVESVANGDAARLSIEKLREAFFSPREPAPLVVDPATYRRLQRLAAAEDN